MKTKVKTTSLLSAMGIWIVLLAACLREPGPSNVTLEVPSGRNANASVSGTVAYRERLALTPGATLIVGLPDVSYADGPRSAYRSSDHLRPRSSSYQVQG